MWAPTPERSWLGRRLQWEVRVFREGTQRPGVDEAAISELWPSVRQAQGHLWGLGRGPYPSPLSAKCCWSPWLPQEGTAGLTGGPWGPGGPGVFEEHAQADGKAGQDSPSFWEKGDPRH